MRTAAFYETTDAERTKNVPACKFVNNQGGRGGTRGQGTLRSVNGDVIYLLRFFLTMPSRDTRQLVHRGVDDRVGSLSRTAAWPDEEVRNGHRHRGRRRLTEGGRRRAVAQHRLPRQPVCR